MVNFWTTGVSAGQGSGIQSAEAPQSAHTSRQVLTETTPPWLHDDLLFEPPTTASHGYVQSSGPAPSDDDHAAISLTLLESDLFVCFFGHVHT